MESGSAFDLNAQFFPLLIRILCGGECSGGKMKTTPFEVQLEAVGMDVQGNVCVHLTVPQNNTRF